MAVSTGRRFAEAAFQIARDANALERWEQDLARVAEVMSDRDFLALLEAPQVPEKVKLDGVTTLLPDVLPQVRNLVSLLVLQGRASAFASVRQHFMALADERRGIARAEVTTAVPLDQQQNRRISDSLARLVNAREVVVTETVDPDILGGVVARVGDRLIDGSARTRLHSLRDSLARRPVSANK